MFQEERECYESENKEFDDLPRSRKLELAKDAVKAFFVGKSLRIGGSIPDRLLYSEPVLDIGIKYKAPLKLWNKVYAAMAGRSYQDWVQAPPQERLYWGPETREEIQDVQNNSSVLPSTEKVIAIIEKIAARKIHKRFSSGILLLYFKHCEGLPIE